MRLTRTLAKPAALIVAAALLFVLVLPASTVQAAGADLQFSFVASPTPVRPSQTLTVTLQLPPSHSTIASFDMQVVFDSSKMTYVKATPRNVFFNAGPTPGESTASPNELTVRQLDEKTLGIIYLDEDGGLSPIAATATSLLDLTFTMNPSVAVGSCTFSGVKDNMGVFVGNAMDGNAHNLIMSIASLTVPIAAPLSKVADLASLTVDHGTLTPAFNRNTTSYNVSVPFTVSSLKVTGTAADSKASVAVSGSTLKAGATTDIKVTVTAEDTSVKKVYTVHVARAADPNPVSPTPAVTPTSAVTSTPAVTPTSAVTPTPTSALSPLPTPSSALSPTPTPKPTATMYPTISPKPEGPLTYGQLSDLLFIVTSVAILELLLILFLLWSRRKRPE